MDIKILEQTHWTPSKLVPIVDRALNELNLDIKFVLINKMADILDEGIVDLPALMIDGKVYISGIVPTVEEVIQLFNNLIE